MNFTELFIRRPVLSMVVSLLILLLGAQGLMNLQVRQYPEVEETAITITTTYTGASADLIQGFITHADRQGGRRARKTSTTSRRRAASASAPSRVHMRLEHRSRTRR